MEKYINEKYIKQLLSKNIHLFCKMDINKHNYYT